MNYPNATNPSSDRPSLPVKRSNLEPVYRVLIVEDHGDTRVMLRTVLETLNFVVLEASDGEMGFEMAMNQVPDLILMDAGLPASDGVAVTRRIRDDGHIGNIPIVFLSGHALPAARDAALEAGGNDYLVKPIDIDEMLLVIARWLSPNSKKVH